MSKNPTYIIDLRIQTPPYKKLMDLNPISPKYKIDLIPFLGHTCILRGNYSTPFITCHLDSAKQPFIRIHQIVALRIDDAQRHRDGKAKWKP